MSKKKDQEIDHKAVADQLAEQNAQLNDQLLRERADAANVRRRAEEDRIKMASFYKAKVIKELLPIIDNFERGMNSATADDDFTKGMISIHKQFLKTLENVGVSRIKTVGEHVNPETMEAVTIDHGDGEYEIVSEELQSGYMLGTELLRPAMVRVKS